MDSKPQFSLGGMLRTRKEVKSTKGNQNYYYYMTFLDASVAILAHLNDRQRIFRVDRIYSKSSDAVNAKMNITLRRRSSSEKSRGEGAFDSLQMSSNCPVPREAGNLQKAKLKNLKNLHEDHWKP